MPPRVRTRLPQAKTELPPLPKLPEILPFQPLKPSVPSPIPLIPTPPIPTPPIPTPVVPTQPPLVPLIPTLVVPTQPSLVPPVPTPLVPPIPTPVVPTQPSLVPPIPTRPPLVPPIPTSLISPTQPRLVPLIPTLSLKELPPSSSSINNIPFLCAHPLIEDINQVIQPFVLPEKTSLELSSLDIYRVFEDKIQPQAGRNFLIDQWGLLYPKVLVDKIISSFLHYSSKEKVNVVLIGGKLGSLVLGFLENAKVDHLYLYENNPQYLEIIKNNLIDYHINKQPILISFNEIPKLSIGNSVFIDPSWLPPSIPYPQHTPDDYLLYNIKIDGEMLDSFIEKLNQAELIVIHLPIHYHLTFSRLFAYDVANINPDPNLRIEASSFWFIVPLVVKEIATRFTGKTDQIIQPINIRVEDIIISKDWKIEIHQFLRDLLLTKVNRQACCPHLSSDEYRDKIAKVLDQENMKIWEKAFTHQSYDPNNNYEELEFHGDLVMGLNFGNYIFSLFPNISASSITNLQNFYLAKVYQAELSNQLGFPQILRSAIKVSISNAEDILESFYGALYQTGNNVESCLGNKLAYGFTVSLFQGRIEAKYQRNPPKTIVQEIFQKYRWKLTSPITTELDGEYETIITFNNEDFPMIQSQFPEIKVNIIARTTGTSKRMTENKAYDEALKQLELWGITWQRADLDKKERERTKGPIKEFWAAALVKSKEDGYTDLEFSKYFKTLDGGSIQLKGITDHREEILITVSSGSNLKENTLQQYALYIYSRDGKNKDKIYRITS